VGRVEGAHWCLGREGRREGGEMDENGSREGEREKRRKKGEWTKIRMQLIEGAQMDYLWKPLGRNQGFLTP